MFKKTYYSRHDVDKTLNEDLHWIEQTKAEFELILFQTDIAGIVERIQRTADKCALGLAITEPEKEATGKEIMLFTGRKRKAPAS